MTVTPAEHTADCNFKHTARLDDQCPRCTDLIAAGLKYHRRRTLRRYGQTVAGTYSLPAGQS